MTPSVHFKKKHPLRELKQQAEDNFYTDETFKISLLSQSGSVWDFRSFEFSKALTV